METGRKEYKSKRQENQPLVSVIMPVYNTEKYVGQAIESVLSQTCPDFELLIVDDGSKDRSMEICEEYRKKDSRIRLFTNDTDMHGPGSARNIGLDYASGEYLYFMDSDDWIDEDLLERVVDYMRQTGADIAQFGVIYERDDGKCSEQYFWPGKDLLTKDEIKKDFFYYWKENRNSLWIHLFRREKVKTIRFESIISGEDISYIMDALCNAEKIAYIAKALYHYRYVEGSTSHHWVENMIEDRKVIWNHQRNYLESFQGGIDKLAYAEVAYDNIIWTIYQLCNTLCPIPYREKIRGLKWLEIEMDFDKYRQEHSVELKHGVEKLKCMLIKYRLERIMLLFGKLFLRIVRGE